jgi:hypothetical protein
MVVERSILKGVVATRGGAIQYKKTHQPFYNKNRMMLLTCRFISSEKRYFGVTIFRFLYPNGSFARRRLNF